MHSEPRRTRDGSNGLKMEDSTNLTRKSHQISRKAPGAVAGTPDMAHWGGHCVAGDVDDNWYWFNGLTIMATQNLMEKILVANLSSGGWLLDLLFFSLDVPIPNAQRAVKAVKVCGYGTMVDPMEVRLGWLAVYKIRTWDLRSSVNSRFSWYFNVT